MRLTLMLLGDFQARLGARPPLRLRTRKTQALLAYLARPPGQAHSRDKLAALLWGDRSQPQARGRFRETLFALRRALTAADPPCLSWSGEAIALDANAVDVDAGAFERLARADDVDALARAAPTAVKTPASALCYLTFASIPISRLRRRRRSL